MFTGRQLGCKYVQLLTGPLFKDDPYHEFHSLSWKGLLKLIPKNFKDIADIGISYNISILKLLH